MLLPRTSRTSKTYAQMLQTRDVLSLTWTRILKRNGYHNTEQDLLDYTNRQTRLDYHSSDALCTDLH